MQRTKNTVNAFVHDIRGCSHTKHEIKDESIHLPSPSGKCI